MILNCRVSLQTFVAGLEGTAGLQSTFTLPAIGLMHLLPQEEVEYGLSILRKSIRLYENKKGIPADKSKADMPFFRQNSRMLIGPEIGLFMLPLHEQLAELPLSDEPNVILSLDYQALGEQCLFENYSLVPCKSDTEPVVHHFMEQLETEYEKFFYDEENSGFAYDSRFFSLLCNACLEIKRERPNEGKEWRLAALRAPEDVCYRYERGDLIPYLPIQLPVECLKQVYLENYRQQPLLFGTLNGFLKSKGLPAEQLLNLT